VLIVDAANVIGSRPTGWWRDRAGAARDFTGRVERAVAQGGLDGAVLLVLEGKARAGVPEGKNAGVRVVHAAGSGHEAKASIAVGVRRSGAPDGPIYPGHAVHDNVLQASVEAYVRAIAALLTDEGVDIAASVPSPGDTDRHETDPDHRSGAKDKIMTAYNS